LSKVGKGRKRFFFEKKNQKTFGVPGVVAAAEIRCGWRSLVAGGQAGERGGGGQAPVAQIEKVFLLLFGHKKKLLLAPFPA
jgi:hypothetical protein